jgi:hypothetical protein
MEPKPKRQKHSTSIVLRPCDREALERMGMTATEAIRAFCSAAPARIQDPRTADLAHVADPSDVLPDPPPVAGHGWTWSGRYIARPSSLAELAELVANAPGPVRLASAHIVIVAEVSS